QPKRGEPLLIDIDLEARNIGQFAKAHLSELGVRVRRREKLVTRSRKLRRRHAAGVLDLHRKTARLTKSTDRPWHQRKHLSIAQAAKGRRGALNNCVSRILAAPALGIVGKIDEGLAGILASRSLAAAGDRKIGLHIAPIVAAQEIAFDRALGLNRPNLG